MILTLAFTTAIFFVISAVLSSADGGARSQALLQSNRALQATAQSALAAGISEFRSHPDDGLAGSGPSGVEHCPLDGAAGSAHPYDLTTPFSTTNPGRLTVNGYTVKLSCTGTLLGSSIQTLGRKVTFIVTCVSAPSGQTCPPAPDVVSAVVKFYDQLGSAVTPVVVNTVWSADF